MGQRLRMGDFRPFEFGLEGRWSTHEPIRVGLGFRVLGFVGEAVSAMVERALAPSRKFFWSRFNLFFISGYTTLGARAIG